MGIFDGFFEPRLTDEVFDYIGNMSKTTLVSTIQMEYFHVKGSCKYTPLMGEFGSFEFAGALLIWKYAKMHLRENTLTCGPLLIVLGDTLGCAYNCMSPGEWSDKLDIVINNNDLLAYTEWNKIYNYLKENIANEIHEMEFNQEMMTIRQRENRYQEFVGIYNSFPDFKSIIDYYGSIGLSIKDDIPFHING